MRILSQIQPLIFSFADTDRLIDGVALLKETTAPWSLSQFMDSYYLTLYCPLSARSKQKTELCEFGSFCGLGVVLDAYIAEHGTRIKGPLPQAALAGRSRP